MNGPRLDEYPAPENRMTEAELIAAYRGLTPRLTPRLTPATEEAAAEPVDAAPGEGVAPTPSAAPIG